MQARVVLMSTCKRCGKPLYPELDTDYGCCLVHGPQYLGAALPDYKEPRFPKVKKGSKAKSAEGYLHE